MRRIRSRATSARIGERHASVQPCRTLPMNAPACAPAAAAGHWLSFRIGTQLYAAPLEAVNEVIRDGDITPVPGVRHLRGRIVPVLDGQRRMGVANVPLDPASVRIVMLAHAEHLVGLRV